MAVLGRIWRTPERPSIMQLCSPSAKLHNRWPFWGGFGEPQNGHLLCNFVVRMWRIWRTPKRPSIMQFCSPYVADWANPKTAFYFVILQSVCGGFGEPKIGHLVRPRLHSRYRSLAVGTPPPHPFGASRACFFVHRFCDVPHRRFFLPSTLPRCYGGN